MKTLQGRKKKDSIARIMDKLCTTYQMGYDDIDICAKDMRVLEWYQHAREI